MNYKVVEAEDHYSYFYVWTWEDDVAFEQAELRVGTFFATPPSDEQIAKLIDSAKNYIAIRKAENAAKYSAA